MNKLTLWAVAVVLPLVAGTTSGQVLLFETFDNNCAGWQLGPEWQIGPAVAYSGGGPPCNGTDPGADAAGVTGGGIAGVNIGGPPSIGAHGFYYLYSPVIDAAGHGALWLEFARWLTSDYAPWMVNTIDVWNGLSWQNIWATGAYPGVNDGAWIPQSFDISTFANAELRVRWGFATNTGTFPNCGSWNLDNVKIFDPGIFYERFNNNQAGWTIGTDWAIGPAAAWSGGPYSCVGVDPGTDADRFLAGGVAGVVIGGPAPTTIHGAYYLVSPPVNTTSMPTVLLAFDRWLTSDYAPYMQNTVDVWDGTAWQNIWTTGGYPGVSDPFWSAQVFDITVFSNPALQVRWGYSVGSVGVYNNCGSWNIDNVSLRRPGQPLCELLLCSPGGAGSGSLQVSVKCPAAAGGVAYTAVTGNAGSFPHAWFLGIDISIPDLLMEFSIGIPPFLMFLDANGNATWSIPAGMPPGITFYLVTVAAAPTGSIVDYSPPRLYTTY